MKYNSNQDVVKEIEQDSRKEMWKNKHPDTNSGFLSSSPRWKIILSKHGKALTQAVHWLRKWDTDQSNFIIQRESVNNLNIVQEKIEKRKKMTSPRYRLWKVLNYQSNS